jgi:hydroxymethylpyrimidine/phosphomethylpyrimidine kinase
MNQNHYILTIAGHDPSGGAGLTSDIKTFEAHGLYGLSVCTAVTVQNDTNFSRCEWLKPELITAQISVLFERFDITVVKIGLVESWSVLSNLLDHLLALNANLKIILDPIIKASAGFDFHTHENQDLLHKIWAQCFIITPNYNEIQWLHPNLTIESTLEHISALTHIYLKGGHRHDKKGWDTLHYNKIVMTSIPPKALTVHEKHGSGCVLSSALASQILLGLPLEDAALMAKRYTEAFLNSNTSLLGHHTYASNSFIS